MGTVLQYCTFIGRSSHSSVVLADGSVLVIGGETRSGSSVGYSNEVFKSIDGGANWALLTNSAWGTNGGNK